MANVSNSETITRLYACPSITLVKLVQWNPVNMDTKVTCHNVCIIRVSVLSGRSEKMSQTHVSLIRRLKLFTATAASSFQRNVTISYYSIGIKLPFSIVLKTRQWRSTLPCTTSVLFRTTFTRTIILNPLMK